MEGTTHRRRIGLTSLSVTTKILIANMRPFKQMQSHIGLRYFLDPETDPQWLRTFLLLFLLVLLSDFQCTKAFSFHNRSSLNFERRLVTIFYAILPCRIFTVRRCALHGICDRNSVCLSVCPSVRLSVRLSVTLVDCVHMVRLTIMISSPHGSPIILVSGDIKFIPKFEGDHPERGR